MVVQRAKSEEVASYDRPNHVVEKVTVFLPLFANVDSALLSTSIGPRRRESRRTERSQIQATTRAICYQFCDGLAAGWSPSDAPAVMASVDVSTITSRNRSHVGESVRWTRPHTSLALGQFGLGVRCRHFSEGSHGCLDSLWFGRAVTQKCAALQILCWYVVRTSNAAQVDSAIGPGIDFH